MMQKRNTFIPYIRELKKKKKKKKKSYPKATEGYFEIKFQRKVKLISFPTLKDRDLLSLGLGWFYDITLVGHLKPNLLYTYFPSWLGL